jgi:hypothetical protein
MALIAFSFCLLCLSLLFQPPEFRVHKINSVWGAFLILLGYQLIRAVWFLQLKLRGISVYPLPDFTTQYLQSLGYWGACFAAMSMAYCFVGSKVRMIRMLQIMSATCFFLAMNAIPALYATGKAFYKISGHEKGFYFPFLYSWDWMKRYVLPQIGHSNQMGDILAIGFYASLGLVLYGSWTWWEQLHVRDDRGWQNASRVGRMGLVILLNALFAGTIASAILLLLSRGTMICFFGTLFMFGLLMALKFLSIGKIRWFLVAFVLLGGYLVWAGRLNVAVREIQTIEHETLEHGTLAVNVEGARRALAIYRAFPLWGTGHGGYQLVAKKFASPAWSSDDAYVLPNFVAMNHYYQSLAEEGGGAYLYFLLFAVCLFRIILGLIRTNSRFKFIAALSLISPALMILVHASFNHLMQRFSTAALVFICIGCSLAVLRKDFQHDSHPC